MSALGGKRTFVGQPLVEGAIVIKHLTQGPTEFSFFKIAFIWPAGSLIEQSLAIIEGVVR